MTIVPGIKSQPSSFFTLPVLLHNFAMQSMFLLACDTLFWEFSIMLEIPYMG